VAAFRAAKGWFDPALAFGKGRHPDAIRTTKDELMSDFKPIPAPGPEPQLSQNARAVLEHRYLARDASGKITESPGRLFSRVALLVAEAEARYGAPKDQIPTWHRTYYDLMAGLRFLPNSPTLMNAKRPNGVLSACFVLPVEDSIEAIFETIKQTALIQKAGGGTGFSFDHLRPAGDRLASSGGTTSGPVSFWRVFSQATDAIQQGAFRRGANMGMMSVEHPDVLRFLHAKQHLASFTNFNISVKLTDAWMATLSKAPNTPQVVVNPRTGDRYLLPRGLDLDSYTLADLLPLKPRQKPSPALARKCFTHSDLWKMITRCAARTSEPGVAFIDRINRDNPTPSLGAIEATNPCGEQPLLAYEACTLGSINLARFITTVNGQAAMDWPALERTVKLSVRFLDNVIDAAAYPVASIARMSQANRKIGLGVMGFADCLFALGIPYDSEPAVEFGEDLMRFVNKAARDASTELAGLRGPFPNWNQSTWRSRQNRRMRNAAVTCVAPTGTISIIADCSGGIEPLYSLVFTRQVLDGKKLPQVHPAFREIAEKAGFWSDALRKEILKTGSITHIKTIPADIRRRFRCAYDIKPQWHVRMQAAFQRHCDAAVSKTVNLPENATAATVDRVYRLAYELGCKGVTVYRRTSRRHEPMSLDE